MPKDKMVILCVHIPFRGGWGTNSAHADADKYYDEVLDLLEGASRGLISRGGLPAHSFRDMVEVNVIGGEEALHVVRSMEDGLFAVYQDPDWSYAIREGEALAAAVEALLPA